MANVEYADMIKTVSGALTKINKKSQHACDQKMVLATHRVAPTESDKCNRLYLRKKVKRTGEPSAKEIAIRERFIAVQAAVNTRANSLEHVTSDQAAFLAQKDTATGKKTMRAYLWYICGQLYDQEHPRS